MWRNQGFRIVTVHVCGQHSQSKETKTKAMQRIINGGRIRTQASSRPLNNTHEVPGSERVLHSQLCLMVIMGCLLPPFGPRSPFPTKSSGTYLATTESSLSITASGGELLCSSVLSGEGVLESDGQDASDSSGELLAVAWGACGLRDLDRHRI